MEVRLTSNLSLQAASNLLTSFLVFPTSPPGSCLPHWAVLQGTRLTSHTRTPGPCLHAAACTAVHSHGACPS